MISVIIPVFNEAECIADTIELIQRADTNKLLTEIIVSDGGSTDDTVDIAKHAGAKVISSPLKGRAAQMNAGAAMATSPVLYFLHADTHPPAGFSLLIKNAIGKGFGAGCFALRFDHKHWFLQANCYFTRFNINAFRFGDQSLFVQRRIFEVTNGYDESHIVVEDQEFIKRLRKITRFTVLPSNVVTSARRYLQNGIFRTQAIFFLVYSLYKLGVGQQKLVYIYKRLIRDYKI